MSSYAITLRQHRRLLMLLTALLVAASIAITLNWAIGDDSSPVSDQVVPASSVSGPDESARGSAAASSAGATPERSGPNEAARGQSAASAVGG